MDDNDYVISAFPGSVTTLMGIHIYMDMIASPPFMAEPSFVVFIPDVKRECHADGLRAIDLVDTYAEINRIIASDLWVDGETIAPAHIHRMPTN
jgi:hypothetical protein